MIGQFYPFPVYGAINVGASFTTVVVRATSAATELTNDQVWLMNVN